MKRFLLFLLFLGVVPMSVNASEEARIEASEVNIRNYERFVAQLERDLPVGTSLGSVKRYLDEHDIGYTDVPNEECLYIMLKRIRRSFFIVTTDLWIRVYFSEGSLSEIKTELIDTAF